MLRRFLRRPSNAFLIAICISLAIALISVSLSPPFNQRPNVNTEQNTGEAVKPQQDAADARVPIDRTRGDERNDGSYEASEYWTVIGHRVKITDSLLVLFTFTLWWATQRLVGGAEDTAERQLRAYISIDPRDVLNWTNQPQRIGVSFHIKNHGQTPGFEILYDFSMLILDVPLATDFLWPSVNRQYDQANTIFPSADVPVRFFFDRDITQDERKAIESGGKRFHVRGFMSYRDAFKEPRTTKFSYSFGGPDFAKGMKDPKAKWNWEHGQTHNDAT
jgi:hypothetical protein